MIQYYNITFLLLGEPCYIGMDITIASFDSISEVNMVSNASVWYTVRLHI